MAETTTKEVIFQKIDFYSNAVVAFIVLQGLAYAFTFGSNSAFNCHVKTAHLLAETLAVSFLLVPTLSIVAVIYLGKQLIQLAPEFRGLLASVTKGKVVVIALFGYSCALLTYHYGVSATIPKICGKMIDSGMP